MYVRNAGVSACSVYYYFVESICILREVFHRAGYDEEILSQMDDLAVMKVNFLLLAQNGPVPLLLFFFLSVTAAGIAVCGFCPSWQQKKVCSFGVEVEHPPHV